MVNDRIEVTIVRSRMFLRFRNDFPSHGRERLKRLRFLVDPQKWCLDVLGSCVLSGRGAGDGETDDNTSPSWRSLRYGRERSYKCRCESEGLSTTPACDYDTSMNGSAETSSRSIESFFRRNRNDP